MEIPLPSSFNILITEIANSASRVVDANAPNGLSESDAFLLACGGCVFVAGLLGYLGWYNSEGPRTERKIKKLVDEVYILRHKPLHPLAHGLTKSARDKRIDEINVRIYRIRHPHDYEG